MSSNKKVIVNGEEQDPIKKTKIPADVDWQKLIKEKREEEEGK